MFKCKTCNIEFDNYDSLRRHSGRVHKIKSEDFYVQFYLNGIYPTCKCGCGEKPKFCLGKFQTYRPGHYARVHNNWGHNKNAIENSAKTRRQQYKDGERKVWNDGLTVADPRVHNNIKHLIKKSKSPEERLRKSKWLSKYIKNHGHMKFQSNLEKKFKTNILDSLNILYETQQFYVKEIGAYYDIKLKDTNILIEIDGDFWHSNPKYYDKPIFECQFKTVAKDKIKTEWAAENGYKLLRFWESDIKNNRLQVVENLIKAIKN